MLCELGFNLAMQYAAGYPTAMQINVVITAKIKLRTSTEVKIGSEKKRAKLLNDNLTLITEFPSIVNA